MVRVIPVHNFLSQNVGQIDEPTASCTANVQGQDMLLLALSSHCVKVYGLSSSQSKLLTVFPTVDSVNKLLHSDKGNYVATLESKTSRDGTTTNNFVRIYVNWEMSGNQNQAMRARIAGRVTPSINRTLNSLEMIELPLNSPPTQIACCQTTGNLLVVMERDAVIHELKVETQQLSKQKFLDFEVRPWSLRFTFTPSQVEIAEEFITVMNTTNFMIFKLTNKFNDDINMINNVESLNNTKNIKKRMNQNARIEREESDSPDTNKKPRKRNSQTKSLIDYKKSVVNEKCYIDWDQLVSKEAEELQRLELLKLIEPETKDFNIILDSVYSDQSENPPNFDPPVVPAPEISAIITTSSNEDSWSENYSIEHLLRLKIPLISSEATKDFENEYFTCCGMKPSYRRSKTLNPKQKKSLLRSQKYNVFNGVTCLICTAQEGYLYHFSPSTKEEISSNSSACTIYPFTSPVSHVALENTALHALTEAGLESYTLRLPQIKTKIIEYEDHTEPDTISLIGLRPFLGVKKLVQAARCLILLASDQDSWTYYSLILPNPEDIYYDILSAANNHKVSSPCTYKYLLGEAYTVLKLAKDMVYYTSDIDYSSNINDTSRTHLDNLYRQSCGLLADFYISSSSPYDWNSCINYYKLAGLSAADVLGRKDVVKAPGIVVYLSDVLLNLQSGPEADALFQEHNIVEILGSAEKAELLKLILASPVLREYATEKLIHVLVTWEPSDSSQFALVLLYTQAGRQQQAEKILEGISDEYIMEATLANWSWLFDVTSVKKGNVIPTFSDYAGIFMRQRTRIFADVVAKLVAKGALTLNQMIQIFLGYLPSRVGRDGRLAARALQLSLETYFKGVYGEEKGEGVGENDVAVLEGFKILVRSYLGELAQGGSQRSEEGVGEDILFGELRPEFLDHPMLYRNEGEGKREMRVEVKKLQGLLASGYLSNESYEEVKRFLETQSIEGSLSYKVLCVRDTEKGIQLIGERCPQVLLMYAKDKYTKESEWKYFVQFLLNKLNEARGNPEAFTIYDELLKDTAIYIAQTMSMRGLQRLLPNDSIPSLQQYIDISSQVVHADYIKTMIMGTGQHLLTNINF